MWKRLVLPTLCALLVSACGFFAPYIPPPPPPAPVPHTLVFSVYNRAGTPVAGAEGRLKTDLFGSIPCPALEIHKLTCPLTLQTGGAWMHIVAPGYVGQRLRVILPLVSENAPNVILEPAVPPLQRLYVDGKSMKREDGTFFAWQGVTAFQLADDIADGREAKAIAFMNWAAANKVTILRVLVMAQNLFQLNPADGRNALSRVLDLAMERGLYVEVVALADTRSYVFDHRAHVSQIGHICTLKKNCVVELANEPNHSTQDGIVKDPTYLASLRRLIPANIPVAYGASHGPADEADTYWGGDYVTVHISRTEGDGGWRWVRHAREIQAGRDNRHGKFVVSDEPDRKAPFVDQHLALGLLVRMYGIGDTVHLASLRSNDIPTGGELEAFNARKLAWSLVPIDMSDARYTAGHLADTPVRVNEKQVLRAYSALKGGGGYTLLIKVTGDSLTQWRRPHTRLTQLGLTQFYSLQ